MPRRLLCCLALALLVACVPPPVDDDTVPEFDPEETRAGKIQERGVLRVGVPDEPRPPFSFPVGPSYQGLLVDLTEEIAAALDVEIEYVATTSDDLLRDADPKTKPIELRTAAGEELDMGFPLVPVTEAIVRRYPMTHPYFVGHQRLLVRNGTGVADVENLGGNRVCSSTQPATGIEVPKLNPEAQVIDATDAGECALLLQNGSVNVVTDNEVELMTVWAIVSDCTQPCPPSTELRMVGDDIATMAFAAVVETGLGWTNFVNATWAETDAEGRWLEFHERWIEPYGLEADEAPTMTIEEAAALFPCDEAPALKCPEPKKKKKATDEAIPVWVWLFMAGVVAVGAMAWGFQRSPR
jgi:polar amino acid transport system substrate-binding protein